MIGLWTKKVSKVIHNFSFEKWSLGHTVSFNHEDVEYIVSSTNTKPIKFRITSNDSFFTFNVPTSNIKNDFIDPLPISIKFYDTWVKKWKSKENKSLKGLPHQTTNIDYIEVLLERLEIVTSIPEEYRDYNIWNDQRIFYYDLIKELDVFDKNTKHKTKELFDNHGFTNDFKLFLLPNDVGTLDININAYRYGQPYGIGVSYSTNFGMETFALGGHGQHRENNASFKQDIIKQIQMMKELKDLPLSPSAINQVFFKTNEVKMK